MLYHLQLYLLEFETSISGVVLYLHITDRPHLRMSGRDLGSTGYSTAPVSLREKIPQRFWVRQQHSLLLCCQTGSIFAFSSWGQIASVFPKELLIWKRVSSPLNNCYHLISDPDWGLSALAGHLNGEGIWVVDCSNRLCFSRQPETLDEYILTHFKFPHLLFLGYS